MGDILNDHFNSSQGENVALFTIPALSVYTLEYPRICPEHKLHTVCYGATSEGLRLLHIPPTNVYWM